MEKQKNKINLKSVLFYIMIIIIILLAIYLIWFTKTESYQCLNQPLLFGVQHLSSSNNESITCTCSSPMSKENLIITKDNMSYSDYSNFNLPKDINS